MLKAIGGLLAIGLIAMFVFVVPVCGCSTRTPGFWAALQSDIRNLDSQQEIYFETHRTYSRSFEDLQFTSNSQVQVEILLADGQGWAARARHSWFEDGSVEQYRGADCVAARGIGTTLVSTTLKGRAPTEVQPVVCDLDGWRSGQSAWQRWRWEISD